MVSPIPTLTLVAILLGVVLVFWWLSRARVSKPEPPVAMMIQRVGFPGGIRVAHPDAALETLSNPDEIVIPFEHAVLEIAFPLTTPAHVPITAPMPIGFTRGALVRAICDEYAHVYEAEEGTAQTKTIPREERGNGKARNRTDGAYGIWGHDLDELVVTAARWSRESNGLVRIELHVEPIAKA